MQILWWLMLNNQCVPCCSERSVTNSTPPTDCCHCNPDTGECINSSVAGKRRIAEWGALHTVPSAQSAPSVAVVTLAVCAAAVGLFITVLVVLQAHSPREQKTRKTSARGVEYSRLPCTDDVGVTVLTSCTDQERPIECEHEPLLEHST
ncbi:hypothetical protein HF086_009901 [Spodoptera exigua]|uniref:Uncharacterized protein n=1 Tax=Spodoptera exigua TaxID=7107 RepID=A0A922M3T6_SPOEX|nr:hypothetical protein HF086_009901 [Spodoptera exigua]